MKKVLLSAFMLAFLLAMMAPAAFAQSDFGNTYRDISGTWFTDSAAKYGYPEIFEDESHQFNPGRKITRIEFVRLLHKALGININYFAAPDIKDYFSDMTGTDIGANELIDLATTGIVESNGNFDPNTPVKREVMIHWIMNALQYESGGNYAMPLIMPALFSDDADISDAYRSEVYSSVALKLVQGRGSNMLFPRDRATRAEAVTIVSNLITLLDSYKSAVHVASSALLVNDGFLAITLTIQNNTDKAVSITHSSGQKYDFKLFDAGSNPLYTWSADKMFIAIVNKTTIQPGEEIVFSDTISSESCDTIKQAVSVKAFIVGTSDEFEINSSGYETAITK